MSFSVGLSALSQLNTTKGNKGRAVKHKNTRKQQKPYTYAIWFKFSRFEKVNIEKSVSKHPIRLSV